MPKKKLFSFPVVKNLVNSVKAIKSKIMKHDKFSKLIKKMLTVITWVKLVIDSFLKNHCMLRASALTYTTFLSIVPFLAVAFSILKGFGFQRQEYIQQLLEKVTKNPDMTNQIVSTIDNANVSALGAIGVGTLLLTVISLLGNIEKSFNVIWGIKKGRSIGRKITDYLSVTLIAPIFMVVALSSTATLQFSNNPVIREIINSPAIKFLLGFTPYFAVGIVLTFLYAFLTNTSVKLKSALGGGIIAGILWQLAQWGFIHFQVAVAKSTALYQKFAPLFIFFLWVYISWVIVLIGAVMSFAFQNLRTFQKEAGALKISNDEKQKLAVKMLLLLTRNFESDEPPITNEVISGQLNIPVTLVNEILFILEKYRIVIQSNKEGGNYFSLIKSPKRIYILDIIQYLNQYKEEEIKTPTDKEYKFIADLFNKIAGVIGNSSSNLNLKDLLVRLK